MAALDPSEIVSFANNVYIARITIVATITVLREGAHLAVTHFPVQNPFLTESICSVYSGFWHSPSVGLI
ncbi:uncharacterized protein FOMMEDRAFT_162136 [Fomitiporia mediterranea MF3/22]|uniref:uncharacterized protein n=1 Tax=Fomitiporia mediterranea (strain MF3/22) TaxID=694068 RepID=UPI0004407274|nr:uncharacterized protein FOMMEDRAFT_162136 [Fomitiporia mediterranea MF3/22]EJC97802.1 hypothetical protein FOMMEDRAFT_162136 [Fomitiporia mediterranea MF3/22]